MTDQLKISLLKNSKDTSNATFSQALEDGLTHSDWLDGRKTSPCGREVALASHSVSPEKAKELMTTDTFGPLFDGLSLSAGLQQFLGNRLRQKLGVNGSPEYVLTWKRWDMCSGPPICALRASVRRTSGKDCFGWPTPNQNGTGPGNQGREGGLNLQTAAQMAGWGTPSCRDQKDHTAQSCQNVLVGSRLGRQVHLSSAQMKNSAGSVLNPLFSLWLQGYPKEWAYCVALEIQSILG
jgi:hypothetical protein